MKVNVFYDPTSYHHQNTARCNKQKENAFIYPVVWSIHQNDKPTFIWSNTKEYGHFGQPKLIFSWGAGLLLDLEGEYAMSEFCFAIIDEPDILPRIKKAMKTKEFIKLMSYCNTAAGKYSWRVLREFRKDFWRDFIETN